MRIVNNFEEIEIYVDGSCLGNPGPGGWAALIKMGNEEKILTGGELFTTNNQMELQAVISALSYFKKPKKIKVYTDSEYVFKGVTQWLKIWEKRDFKTYEGKSIKNRELWKILKKLNNFHQITWEKVSAHSKNLYNEKVDKLAKLSAKKWKEKS